MRDFGRAHRTSIQKRKIMPAFTIILESVCCCKVQKLEQKHHTVCHNFYILTITLFSKVGRCS